MLPLCADVPQGRPIVRVKETSPNMVILEVDPPRNNGGKEVTGYRVEFGRKMTDYAVGLFSVLHIIIIITIIIIASLHNVDSDLFRILVLWTHSLPAAGD